MTITELDVAFTERFTRSADSLTPPSRARGLDSGPSGFFLPDDTPEKPQGFYPVQTKSFRGFGFFCGKCHLMYAVAPARVFHCKRWESRPVEIEIPAVAATPVRVPDMATPTLRQRVKSFVIRYL